MDWRHHGLGKPHEPRLEVVTGCTREAARSQGLEQRVHRQHVDRDMVGSRLGPEE